MRAGTDGQWPAALAECEQLQTLHLHGSSAAPLPRGRYLNRLKTLNLLCDPRIAVPHALAAATALEDLSLKIKPQRLAASSVLDLLPNLQSLCIHGPRARCYSHENSLLDLQWRLRARIMYLP